MQVEEVEFTNDYSGLLPKWQADLMVERARLKGIRPADLDDVLEEIVLEVLAFRYDPAKSNGATESTALTALIDRRILNFRREKRRYSVRVKLFEEESDVVEPGYDPSKGASLRLDVAAVVDSLPPLEQAVCRLLMQGLDRIEVEAALKLQHHAYRYCRDRIQAEFARMGFGEDFNSDD